MARALLARRAGPPPEDPVALYEGPYGITPIPIAIEPGACYLAVAAVTLVLTSVTPGWRNTERQGGVTVDSSHFVVHGTIRAVLDCLDSAKTYRALCAPETFTGTF